MRRIIKIGTLVIVTPKKAMGEVQGFERIAGDLRRIVVVRILKTGEIIRVHDTDLDVPHGR